MLKLLLVDDQPRELAGITKLLDWPSMGIEIAGTAKSGQDALKLADKLCPDLVITDIIMPDMDGISLIEELRRKHPKVCVICISCFDDFKFVSMAINRGASGYVLKPILARELNEVALRVVGDIRARDEHQRILTKYNAIEANVGLLHESLGLRLLQGGLSQRETQTILNTTGWNDSFLVACMGNVSSLREVLLYLPKRRICAERMGNEVICLFHIANDSDKEVVLKELYASASIITETFNRRALVGVSGICSALQLIKGYEDASISLDFSSENDANDKYSPSLTEKLSLCSQAQLRFEIKEIAIHREKPLLAEFLNNRIPSQPIGLLRKASVSLWMLLAEEFGLEQPNEYDENFKKASSFYTKEDAIRFFNDVFEKTLGNVQGEYNQNKLIVNRIIEYIANHISENIQLRELLKDFYISSGYANVLFKNETGLTIHQYVVNERMKQAACILRENPGVKIYDVASEVGYPDVAYFTNAFKKAFSCTPSQYVLRHEKKEGLSNAELV